MSIRGPQTPFETTSLERRPDLGDQARRLGGEGWPPFFLHGDVTHWERLFDEFAGYQILLCDPSGRVISLGHTIPFMWDGTAEDLPDRIADLMERAVADRRDGRGPNALSALAAVVAPPPAGPERGGTARHALAGPRVRPGLARGPRSPDPQGGLPADALREVRPVETGRRFAVRSLAPRPPQAGGGTNEADTEVRHRQRHGCGMGGMDMAFPESGEYVAPSALEPVRIDHERDLGRYDEPNFWMRHPIR